MGTKLQVDVALIVELLDGTGTVDVVALAAAATGGDIDELWSRVAACIDEQVPLGVDPGWLAHRVVTLPDTPPAVIAAVVDFALRSMDRGASEVGLFELIAAAAAHPNLPAGAASTLAVECTAQTVLAALAARDPVPAPIVDAALDARCPLPRGVLRTLLKNWAVPRQVLEHFAGGSDSEYRGLVSRHPAVTDELLVGLTAIRSADPVAVAWRRLVERGRVRLVDVDPAAAAAAGVPLGYDPR